MSKNKYVRAFEDFLVYGIVSASMLLGSCSTQHHIQRADHHKERAIEKGAVFSVDTTIVTNTIMDTTVVNDTVYVTEIVTNTVTEAGEIRYITRKDKRHERKDKRRMARYVHRENMRFMSQSARTDRTEIRQDNRTTRSANRKLWWLWMLIGIVIGAAGVILIKRFFKIL